MESHRQIEDQAAAWLAQRDSGDWKGDDQAHLTQWMQASTAHRVAFLRLEAVWEEARRLKALSAGLKAGTVPPPGEWRQSPFFSPRHRDQASDVTEQSPGSHEVAGNSSAASPRERRGAKGEVPARKTWVRISAAAATLFLAVGIGTYFKQVHGGDRFSTPIGEIASVPLSDGSNITLNTGSRVYVDLGQTERRVDLEQGEAFFVVAKDPNRPFVVEVGNKRVIAVGTQFSVRRDGDDVRVVVTEGTVRLEASRSALRVRGGEASSQSLAVSNAGPGSATPESARLTAGTIAHATDGDVLVQNTSVPQAEEMLSWRQGYLTFHETPLADATEEFNRYNRHKILIEDPKVAAIRISGTFRPTNYEAFVRLLEDGYSIHAKSSEDTTSLAQN